MQPPVLDYGYGSWVRFILGYVDIYKHTYTQFLHQFFTIITKAHGSVLKCPMQTIMEDQVSAAYHFQFSRLDCLPAKNTFLNTCKQCIHVNNIYVHVTLPHNCLATIITPTIINHASPIFLSMTVWFATLNRGATLSARLRQWFLSFELTEVDLNQNTLTRWKKLSKGVPALISASKQHTTLS